MRLGLMGPAHGDAQLLSRALSAMLADDQLDQVLYLSADHTLSHTLARCAAEIMQDTPDEDTFLRRGVELACQGTADDIERLLQADRAVRRLDVMRRLPPPPARVLEVLDKWLLLGVYDKAVLDEEDIVNAHVIAYGHAEAADLKRFGPRYFVTPGPLSGGVLGTLESLHSGALRAVFRGFDGRQISEHLLEPSKARLVVTP